MRFITTATRRGRTIRASSFFKTNNKSNSNSQSSIHTSQYRSNTTNYGINSHNINMNTRRIIGNEIFQLCTNNINMNLVVGPTQQIMIIDEDDDGT